MRLIDFGAHSLNPGDDYPDFVIPLAQAVAAGEVERGVAICGSGVGAAVCANKVPGIRAAIIHDHFSARQGVEDDHMNVLCMGGRTVGPAVAWDLVQTFLGSRVQPGRATPAAPGQSGFLGEQEARKAMRKETPVADEKMVQLAINTIRTLAMDAVQQANSGHPGTPMALAPVAKQP